MLSAGLEGTVESGKWTKECSTLQKKKKKENAGFAWIISFLQEIPFRVIKSSAPSLMAPGVVDFFSLREVQTSNVSENVRRLL